MAQRTLKNYTAQDLILRDLGMEVIPANGAKDLGGNESRLLELASSEDLILALVQGTDKYQVNDGSKDLTLSEGIELIRKIQRPTEVDELGRWVVRADSRKAGWDTVFQGAGDNMITNEVGGGTPFTFDFSAPVDDLRWHNESAPQGYKRQIIDWQFCDQLYVKEGAVYYYNLPKGTVMNASILSPPGTYIENKSYNPEDLSVVRSYGYNPGPNYIQFVHWVINYQLEGSAPLGNELNTESAAEVPAQPWFVFRNIIDVPEVPGWEQAHGHWSLEIYRMSQGPNGPIVVPASKMVT